MTKATNKPLSNLKTDREFDRQKRRAARWAATTELLSTLEAENERLKAEKAVIEARVAELEAAARVAPSFDSQRELEIGLGDAEIEAVAGVLKRRYITGPDGRDYEAYLKAFSKLAERPTLCPFSDSREVLARVFVKA